MIEKCERKSNFELIRIIAMLMIIGSHLAVHGVMHVLYQNDAYVLWYSGNAINKIFTSALTMGGELGVALFFMITGYFMIYDDRIKLDRLLCETLYYGVITVFFFNSILDWI